MSTNSERIVWRETAEGPDRWSLMSVDHHIDQAQRLVAETRTAAYMMAPFTFAVAQLHLSVALVKATQEAGR